MTKLSSRIMSWILSPGAYAVWHALGNPEEWDYVPDRDFIRHKTTAVQLVVMNEATVETPYFIAGFFAFLAGFFLFDARGDYEGSIGIFERHLVVGRAVRTRNKLRKMASNSRTARNRALFAKLTVNE